MSHFSKDLLDAAPETLAALREILHGPRSGSARNRKPVSAPAAKEGRFLGGKTGREAPVRRRRSALSIGA